MIIRNTTLDGDFTFGKGLSDYRRNLSAILLNIQTRLKSWKGDCFFAAAEGVDYNNFLDVGTKNFLDSDIKRVILQSEGVLKIQTYESVLDRGDRDITIRASIITTFGIGSITV